MSKTRAFSPIVRLVILQGLNFLKNKFINNIQVPKVREGMSKLLEPIRETVRELSDGDPKNEEQVKETWSKFANTELYDFTSETVQEQLARIEDANLRSALSHLAVPTTKMIQIMTDENPDNAAQLKEHWGEFVANPTTHEIVLNDLLIPLVISRIPDEDTQQFIIGLLRDILQADDEIDVTRFLSVAENFITKAS